MDDKTIDQAYGDLRTKDMVETDLVGNGYAEFNTLTGTLKKTTPLFKTLNNLALKTDNNLNTLLAKDMGMFLGSIGSKDWNALPLDSGWYQVDNTGAGKNAPTGTPTTGFMLNMAGTSGNTQFQIFFPNTATANSSVIPRIRSTWSNPAKWSAWTLITQGYTKEEIDAKDNAVKKLITDHIASRTNPHNVNAEQVNTYNKATIDSKVSQTQANLNNHINNKTNPHAVTASQVGAMPNGTAYTKAEVNAKLKTISDSKQDKLVEYSASGADGFSGWHGAVYFHRVGRVCNIHIDLSGGGIGLGTKMVSIRDWAVPDTKFNVSPHFVVMGGGSKAGTCYVSITGKAIYVENIAQGGRVVGNVTYITN